MVKVLVAMLVVGMMAMYPKETVRVFKVSVDGVAFTYNKTAPIVKNVAKKVISKVEKETKTVPAK
jgi:hypothetical protein